MVEPETHFHFLILPSLMSYASHVTHVTSSVSTSQLPPRHTVRVQLYQPTIYETNSDFYESYETDNLQSACLHYVGCTDHVIVTLTPGTHEARSASGPGVGTASWKVLS